MASVEYSAVIESSAEQVWRVLSHFGGIAEWHPAIEQSHIEGEQPGSAVGAIRRLDLADSDVLRERLLTLDDHHMALSYAFEESPLPLDNYQAQVKVAVAEEAQQCVVEWKATFDVREPEAAAHFEKTIRELIVGGHESLAAFVKK